MGLQCAQAIKDRLETEIRRMPNVFVYSDFGSEMTLKEMVDSLAGNAEPITEDRIEQYDFHLAADIFDDTGNPANKFGEDQVVASVAKVSAMQKLYDHYVIARVYSPKWWSMVDTDETSKNYGVIRGGVALYLIKHSNDQISVSEEALTCAASKFMCKKSGPVF